MSLRFRIEVAALLLTVGACERPAHEVRPEGESPPAGVIVSALTPGADPAEVSQDPRAAAYYDNSQAVLLGMALFKAFNCAGCHSNGGGGMGPDLLDDEWIYGGRLDQIHDTIVQGRPNGMPAWGGKIPDQQIWQIAAYVRSMSLPQTLEAQHGPTPSQAPAPVPAAADQHNGWALPPETTNDFTSTLSGGGP